MNILAFIWGGIIGFCIVMYVILDGFTLGTGLLMPFMNERERDLAMSVILPTWDGNQTWLVLGTAALYGAFPLAFSMLLPVFYLPLLLMAITLLFRGIAFEFRLKAKAGKKRWDWLFIFGSLFATLIQGIILGNFVEGFTIVNGALFISEKHVINSFSLFTALSLVFGYSLLSSTRLILKLEGSIQDKMFFIAKICAWLIAFASLFISLWSPFINAHIYNLWFDISKWLYLAPLPILNGFAFILLIWSLYYRNDVMPYWASVLLFLCPYVGFIVSLYPYIIPYQIPYWEAAAPAITLKFILVGAVIMLPVLLFYTGYAYRIFRGKVHDVISY